MSNIPRDDRDHTELSILLAELPPESVRVLENFARFLREQARQGEPVGSAQAGDQRPYLYPTVPVSPALLDSLIGIMPAPEGDALADSEALYDP